MQTTPAASQQPQPSTPCRCCGRELEAKPQQGSVNVAASWLLTCKNETCVMMDFTFTDVWYPNVDLDKYVPCKTVGG